LTAHIRARGEEIAEKIRTPGWRARRWVVEASHSWLNRNRGILIRWCKKDQNHLALLQLAAGLIAFKKAQAATAAARPTGIGPYGAPSDGWLHDSRPRWSPAGAARAGGLREASVRHHHRQITQNPARIMR